MRKLCVLLLVVMFAAAVAWVGPAVVPGPMASSEGASGGGHYVVAGSLDVQFAFSAVQHDDGQVSGSFHDSTNDGQGAVDFDADVTCIAIDHDLGRAWIGGVITANRSTSPDYTGPLFQPGHDVWFRVLDTGEEGDHQDRRTFLGFEGGAYPSSAAYCAARPWPPDNARTWPVTHGNITVR
jgi:hypothetical protein